MGNVVQQALFIDSNNDAIIFLCNRYLVEGVSYSELKLDNVLLLFKSGDVMSFNNYRPVSLLCTLPKVFEKVMYSRLLNCLDYHKILIGNQFGFRKLHSSYMVLMLMMDLVTKALDNEEKFIETTLWTGLGATCQIETNMCHTMAFAPARNWLNGVFRKGLYLDHYCSWSTSMTRTMYVANLCLYYFDELGKSINKDAELYNISLWWKINKLSLNVK